MNRYLVLNQDDRVVNIIVWDGVSLYQPEDGHRLESCDNVPREVGMNWQLVDGQWVAPESSSTEA